MSKDRGFTAHLIRKVIQEILKEHIEEITETAVSAAAVSITNKGILKLLDRLQEVNHE